MTTDRPHVVTAQLLALVADLQTNESAVGSGLVDLVDSARQHVPGADSAGITLASRNGDVKNLAATDAIAAQLDSIQHSQQEGPCLAAAREHHTVVIDDVAIDERWPRYCREVIERTPIRSVLSFEMSVNHESAAALNLYSERERAFDDEAQEIGLIFATHTALAWNVLKRDEQFRSALASRDLIGQAKGIVMERFRVDAVDAFELLKRLSQQSNIKISEVARQLIESENYGRNGE